jgi:Na+-transporting NADH:ubiquinone oxidoreductase subunit F
MEELIKAVAVVSALGGVFALVLVIADALFNRYGDVMIDVNQGARKLKVRGGNSLLVALMTQKIFIPSACGGRATCAYCKVKVTSGGGPLLPMEEPYLSPGERAAGVRLSCQVKLRSDLAIEIPVELFGIRQYEAVVERITDLTYDIKEVRFKLREPAAISFKPGQYVQLEAPEYPGNAQAVYRAYSISSAAQDSGAIELIIRLVPNGLCTTWVFKHLKAGDRVRLNGPYGAFYLRPTDRRLVFIAGGSGFAPFKSILQSQPAEIARRGATFFFGARAARDLFHLELMKRCEAEMPAFRFVPALSMPEAEDRWTGERGLITEALDRNLPDASNTEFYLCGSPGMIDACAKVLRAKGVADDVIFFDKFA